MRHPPGSAVAYIDTVHNQQSTGNLAETALSIMCASTSNTGFTATAGRVRGDRAGAMAELDDEGGLRVLLKDYPYAEDGLLIWDALKKWNDDYLVSCTGCAAVTSCMPA